MHPSTFEYLKPTDAQLKTMEGLRKDFAAFCRSIEAAVPDGPDKTYLIRELRKCGMWANVAITRQPDGSPRS